MSLSIEYSRRLGMVRVVGLLAALALVAPPARAGQGGVIATSGMVGPQRAGSQTERVHLFSTGGERCLQVASAGVRTRHAVTPGSATASGTIMTPSLPGPIVWAGLYWAILANKPPVNAVTLNGVPVVPVPLPVTGSPCWDESFAYPYFADVTKIAVTGANVIAGLDDSGAFNRSPESEGASLVVVYQDANAGACEIIVMDGNDLVDIQGEHWTNTFRVTCGDGHPASLTFIGADGQTLPSYDFHGAEYWNDVPLGDHDDFDASDPGAPGAARDVGWDTDTWNVVTGAPNAVSADPGPGTPTWDCFSWIATVLAVGGETCAPSASEPSTWGRVRTLFR